ncbi:MAG TPA: acyl-phosphate glycerol 3-phosphate acyltransferase, partial [Gammaproteobacteria bacterium]|nr:acyl-phosphate glycerol 3-phosphate acyltransferase [Gammaproteobacteria bacterium]
GRVIGADSSDVFVSWLPLYHDMGLIGAWLGSLYHAALFVVMSPLSFLARPERWLRAMHRYRGTLSASPNFGYEYCLRRIDDEDIKGVDLSSWRAAFNGAEPVSVETLEGFSSRFQAYGFSRKAMTPVYGLAESTVGLAFPPPGRGPLIDTIERDRFMRTGSARPVTVEDKQALRFVSSGSPLPGHQIRIVDQAGHELPERQEGRIEFHGPSATSGYYRDAERTARLFDGEWLDSGDLGYMANAELYVTGRIKDIIIRAGRNIYPHELEEAVGNIPGIRTGRVAVFGSEDRQGKTERLVVMAETRSHDKQLHENLRKQINTLATDLIGSPPDEVVLAPPGTILKTSSGKIRRAASRELYEQGRVGKKQAGVYLQVARVALAGLLPQARRGLRYARSLLFASWSWSAYGVLAAVAWSAVMFLPGFALRWSIAAACARLFARVTATPLSVDGLENIPAQGQPCVLVCNHASYLDGYALIAALPRRFHFVAKKELADSFFSRIPLQRIHTEFVDRFETGKSLRDTQQLVETLKAGNALIFFAEGTFTRVPGLRPFMMGAFVAAARAEVPVIPVAIRGTRSILRAGSWFPHHGAISIHIGRAIEPGAVAAEASEKGRASDEWHTAIALRERSREYILRHCGEPDLLKR